MKTYNEINHTYSELSHLTQWLRDETPNCEQYNSRVDEIIARLERTKTSFYEETTLRPIAEIEQDIVDNFREHCDYNMCVNVVEDYSHGYYICKDIDSIFSCPSELLEFLEYSGFEATTLYWADYFLVYCGTIEVAYSDTDDLANHLCTYFTSAIVDYVVDTNSQKGAYQYDLVQEWLKAKEIEEA